MPLDVNAWQWTREPADYSVSAERIEIITKPHTDLWQRTYYHFPNANCWPMMGSSRMEMGIDRIRLNVIKV